MRSGDLIIPLLILSVLVWGLIKRVNIADCFCKGAKENLITAAEILPALILLMTAVGMFRASGASEILAKIISPLTKQLGFPNECVSLALIRPVSGSGALAVLESILSSFSPDSFTGRVASVLMGSTETTFYTITVYFSAIRKKSLSVYIHSSSYCRLDWLFILRYCSAAILLLNSAEYHHKNQRTILT